MRLRQGLMLFVAPTVSHLHALVRAHNTLTVKTKVNFQDINYPYSEQRTVLQQAFTLRTSVAAAVFGRRWC